MITICKYEYEKDPKLSRIQKKLSDVFEKRDIFFKLIKANCLADNLLNIKCEFKYSMQYLEEQANVKAKIAEAEMEIYQANSYKEYTLHGLEMKYRKDVIRVFGKEEVEKRQTLVNELSDKIQAYTEQLNEFQPQLDANLFSDYDCKSIRICADSIFKAMILRRKVAAVDRLIWLLNRMIDNRKEELRNEAKNCCEKTTLCEVKKRREELNKRYISTVCGAYSGMYH